MRKRNLTVVTSKAHFKIAHRFLRKEINFPALWNIASELGD